MIANDQELKVTFARIDWFHSVVTQIREKESNPATYRASAGGFLAEIDRMQLEVREYLSVLPVKIAAAAANTAELGAPGSSAMT